MYRVIVLFIATLLLSSCMSSPITRGSGSSYATRDAEVVFGDEQTYPRIALVIGNNDYQRNRKLINAVPDARAIRDFLQSKGFRVVYAENADKNTMDSKINEFLDGLGRKSIAVIYYAGHATQDRSRKTKEITNYIIPINDTTLTKYITDYDNDAISFNNILNKIDEINHGLNIAMLDACRTPIGRGGNIQNIGAEGVYLVYSTASGVTASDSGAFRRSFLKYANQPLKLTDIFGKVKLDLRKEGQRPSIQNDIVGDFYFTQAIKPTPTPTPVVKPQVVERIVYQDRPQSVVTTPVPIAPQTYSDKWITPTKSICENSGGKIGKYGCLADWSNAKKICRASGGLLPTKEVLRQVVMDCGGEMKKNNLKEWKRNNNNSSYQSCYKEKGFTSGSYWSSTSNASVSSNAWVVYFYNGGVYRLSKINGLSVRCVRGRSDF